jgi:hypothetical protein
MYLGESSIPQWKLCTFLRCMTLTSTSRSWVGPRPNLPLPPSVQPSHCGVAPSPFQSERSTGTRPDHLPEANHLFVNLPRSHADQPSITAFFSWPAHSNSETATFSSTGIRPSANVFSRRRIANKSAHLLLSSLAPRQHTTFRLTATPRLISRATHRLQNSRTGQQAFGLRAETLFGRIPHMLSSPSRQLSVRP